MRLRFLQRERACCAYVCVIHALHDVSPPDLLLCVNDVVGKLKMCVAEVPTDMLTWICESTFGGI